MNILKCHICKSEATVQKRPYVSQDGKDKCEYWLECPLCRDGKRRKHRTFCYSSKATAVKKWNEMVKRNKGETLESVWPLWLKKKHNRYK